MGEMLPGHIEALQAELARVRAERDKIERAAELAERRAEAAEARCARIAEEKVAEIVAVIRNNPNMCGDELADAVLAEQAEFGSVAGDATEKEPPPGWRRLAPGTIVRTDASDANEGERP